MTPRLTEAFRVLALFMLGLWVAAPSAHAQDEPQRSVVVRATRAPAVQSESWEASLRRAQIRQAMRSPVPASALFRQKRTRRVALLALGGAGGWLVGAAVGGGIGYLIDREGNAFLPFGTALGVGGGALIGAPLGVHLANGRQGSYLLDLLASAGVGIGSAALLASVLDTQSASQSVFIIGVPITLQIGTSVAVERTTAF